MLSKDHNIKDPEREKRIQELLSKMTLDEKIAQMTPCTNLLKHAIMLPRYNMFTYDSGENRRLGIPAKKFTDGPRGVTVGSSTCFPVSMARGAAWDPELEERIGSVIGYEARARGANYFGGVCINLLRHPGWGRAQETYGEDPYHLGVLGVGLVKGVQKHALACAKHFACNSIEESRFFVNVKCDQRTLREIYLPHFKMCVDAGVASIMSAYNQVNGELCGHNGPLLKGILKDEWGFDGFVISDFMWGVKDTKAAANNGLDIEMPVARFYGKKLKKAVGSGDVPEKNIDDAVIRILRQKDRFAKVGEPGGYDNKKVACAEHAELALEAAHKSIVLLKNENSVLPFDLEKIKNLAVIGKTADKAVLGDMGSSRVRPPYAITPLQGIRDRAGSQINVIYNSGSDLTEAARIAREADAVILVAGLSWKEEGEFLPIPLFKLGGDRLDLDLPRKQQELIKTVAAQNENCVVVLEGGSAITMEAWKDKVHAILMAWYPGMEGGNAIADILFGKVNPSGKLPIVFPESVGQLPFFDNKVKEIEYGYFHGYRLFDKKGMDPAFAFGFGLSYTQFKYSGLALDRKVIGGSGMVEVELDVANIGKTAGEEIVQLYVGYAGSKVERPIKDLKAFKRLALGPGETKTISFELAARDLAYYDAEKKCWEVEQIEYIVYAGSSSRMEDLHLRDTFKVYDKN